MPALDRRTALQLAASSAVVGASPAGASTVDQDVGWQFLTADEATFLTAACDRIIPADPPGPGAVEAGCVVFIDRQLAGPYGSGARLYLQGPFRYGVPGQGYQLPLSPARLYRFAIAEIDRGIRNDGRAGRFADLPVEDRDALLAWLGEDGGEAARWSRPFFDMLRANTVEGYFADPIYGGNRGMAAWSMIGFPGAYAQWVELVDEHDVVFSRPPLSIADAGVLHHHHAP